MRRKRNLGRKEEIEMLRKGIQKYPKGTSRRWKVISGYIGTRRLVEEILKATKTILLHKPDSFKAFDLFLEKRKPAQAISSLLTTRIESKGLPVEGTQDSSSKMATKQSTSTTNNQEPVDGAVLAFNGVSSGTEQDSWSETQERALIQALKTFQKDINRCWEHVAAAVPGKTVIQCRRKFALMKENFRSNKNVEQ